MTDKQISYRQIMKGTSLFGGVQVFNIIISIVRSKVIAVLLGPSGMGIAALFLSATNFISILTSFGLGTSAVKDVAAANRTKNEIRIAQIIIVFRRLVWFTGLLGAITTLVFASWLSEISFGNKDFTIAFSWLSCTLLLNQLTRGQNVLLQGLRKLQYLAKANIIGALFGFIISLPIYYYLRINGIVLAIILSSFITYVVALYFSKKLSVRKINVAWHETILVGKGMMKMGFMLSLGGLMTAGGSFIVRVFISKEGGIDDVGLYNAGLAIITTYTGLVLSAMATDYYPRLSGIVKDNAKATLMINQQAEIGLLILAPILTVFLIFINWVVVLLYSSKFTPINEMIHWAALGMYFKVTSWAIGFILLAKGASKVYFWNELIANIYMLVLNLIGYNLYGLEGLGISLMISYMLYLPQIYLLAKYRYEFEYNNNLLTIFIVQFTIGVIGFLIMKFLSTPWSYVIGAVLIAVSCGYSYVELDKRMDIKSFLSR